MNVTDIILLVIIGGVCLLAVRKLLRDKKNGRSCCGDCSSCKKCD